VAVLLNAVLPSHARFKNESGKRVRKATIADCQESFVLRLTTLNDYHLQIEKITNKYYSSGLVEGVSNSDIKQFFVFFNNTLHKFKNFIACVDTCLKIFQIFSLDYPQACKPSWLFIQQFFFEINTPFDFKSGSITSLINYLKFVIYKIKNMLHHEKNLYILSQQISVTVFDRHFHAFEIGYETDKLIIKHINEFGSAPLYIYPLNNGKSYARYK